MKRARAIITMTNDTGQLSIHRVPHLEGLDRGFLERTVRTTLVLGAVLTGWLVQTLQMPLLGGFAAGVLIGVGGLALSMWAVDQASCCDLSWRRYIPACVMLVKAVAFYLALRVLIWRWQFSVAALAAGAGLVMIVIVLKAIGRMLAPAPVAGSTGHTLGGR